MQPSIFLSDLNNRCLTFYWPGHPAWYIGYRLVEGNPLISPTPVDSLENQPRRALPFESLREDSPKQTVKPPYPEWLTYYQESDPDNPDQFSFQSCDAGALTCSASLNLGTLHLAWLFEPTENGVWITLQITTQTDLTGVFGIQQCLRFTGRFNEYWRRKVAMTPFLSEFDLHAIGQPNRTLSFARQHDRWLPLPVPYTVFHATPGLQLDDSDGSTIIDHGLILRETLDRQAAPHWYWEKVAHGAVWDTLTAGMYWERTVLVSNRHPADCLHAMIDLAPLQAGQTRTIHGKFYCLEGSKDDLLETWRKDFQ